MLINVIHNDKDKFVLDIDAMKPISHIHDTIRSEILPKVKYQLLIVEDRMI